MPTVAMAWRNALRLLRLRPYTEHSDLPGLLIEADTPPAAIKELLEGTDTRGVAFAFIAPGHVKIAA